MDNNTGSRGYMQSIFNGQTPVKRQTVLPGQSKYYYYKPGQSDDIAVSDMKTVDVPTADTPNPFWGEKSANPYSSPIKNEIYNKDRKMYNQLYGDIPPQATKPPVQSRVWESASERKTVYDDVVKNEGNVILPYQDPFEYTASAIQGGFDLVRNFSKFRKMKATDKYKHAMMNCIAAQHGQGGADIAEQLSNLREWNDVRTGANSLDSSEGDQYANKIGRLLGSKYPTGDCDEYVQKYIKKSW